MNQGSFFWCHPVSHIAPSDPFSLVNLSPGFCLHTKVTAYHPTLVFASYVDFVRPNEGELLRQGCPPEKITSTALYWVCPLCWALDLLFYKFCIPFHPHNNPKRYQFHYHFMGEENIIQRGRGICRYLRTWYLVKEAPQSRGERTASHFIIVGKIRSLYGNKTGSLLGPVYKNASQRNWNHKWER